MGPQQWLGFLMDYRGRRCHNVRQRLLRGGRGRSRLHPRSDTHPAPCYDDGLRWLQQRPRATRSKCILSLGSTIGSMACLEAAMFIRSFVETVKRSTEETMFVRTRGPTSPYFFLSQSTAPLSQLAFSPIVIVAQGSPVAVIVAIVGIPPMFNIFGYTRL
jgi:hypothetical protein